jgi:hypothetical protein
MLGGFLFAKERVIRVVYIEPLTGDSEEIKEQALSLGACFSKKIKEQVLTLNQAS